MVTSPGRDPGLDDIVSRLVQAFHPMRIYRFGCRKGDAAAGCDCDLMVIVDESGEPSERRTRAAHDALEGLRPPKDVVVLTRDEFDRRAHLGGVPASISWAGSLLYGR